MEEFDMFYTHPAIAVVDDHLLMREKYARYRDQPDSILSYN